VKEEDKAPRRKAYLWEQRVPPARVNDPADYVNTLRSHIRAECDLALAMAAKFGVPLPERASARRP
jgi:hypothetical protein